MQYRCKFWEQDCNDKTLWEFDIYKRIDYIPPTNNKNKFSQIPPIPLIKLFPYLSRKRLMLNLLEQYTLAEMP